MKQRRHYSSGRQYRKSRTNSEYSGRSGTSKSSENNELGVALRAFDLEAFPPATLLQEYEYATDGAANRLIDMALEEQQRRFAREEADDRFNKKTVRIAQFFGFISFLVVLIETLVLFIYNREQLGLILFFGALGFGLISPLSVAFFGGGSVIKSNVAQKTKPTACSGNRHAEADVAKTNTSQPQERRHNNGNSGGGNYRGNGHHNHRRRDDRARGRRRSSSRPSSLQS